MFLCSALRQNPPPRPHHDPPRTAAADELGDFVPFIEPIALRTRGFDAAGNSKSYTSPCKASQVSFFLFF